MGELVGLFLLLGIALAVLIVLLTTMLVFQATHPPRRTAAYAIANGIAIDPGDLGLRYEAWTLDRPDGARLAVWQIDPGSSEPGEHLPQRQSSLTAVLVHGWGRSRIDMLQRIEPWRRACGRIVLYDLRGHGESTGPSRIGQGEDEDLIDLLERLGEGRFVLVGTSMGAGIVLNAAARDSSVRDRIAGVISYGAYHDFHASLRGRMTSNGYPGRPFTNLAILWLGLRGVRVPDHRIAASRLDCPLLVVHGSDDPIVAFQQAQAIAAAASRSHLHRVDGGGHGNEHIVDPQAHDLAVARFLEQLKRPDQAASSERHEARFGTEKTA
jgi:pimeloyl-ACP methyl ester carboxylesterase